MKQQQLEARITDLEMLLDDCRTVISYHLSCNPEQKTLAEMIEKINSAIGEDDGQTEAE